MLNLQLSDPEFSMSGRRTRLSLLCAALACFPAISQPVRAADTRPCTPQMLDVQVLPLLEPYTVNQLHGLAIEIVNRSQSSCQLQGPSVELLPRSSVDTFTNSFFSDQEMSPSERQFQDRHSALGPEEAAHLLIAWHSLDSSPFPGCLNRDRLTLSLGLNLPPVLMVEHLWLRLSDR